MHKYLSCAISRLPVLKANTILRVSRHLPGLHPQHLSCWSSWSIVLARVSVVIDREGRPRFSPMLTRLSSRAYFRYWHQTDIADVSVSVGFGGNSGHRTFPA